jgi:hypothetical protein
MMSVTDRFSNQQHDGAWRTTMKVALTAMTILASSAALAKPPTSPLIGGANSQVYGLDQATGAAVLIDDWQTSSYILGMTTDSAGVVYALDVDLNAGLAWLDRFDSNGALAAQVPLTYLGTQVGLAEGLSFAPNKSLYVSFRYGTDHIFQSGHVGVVNPATGVINPSNVVQLSGVAASDGDTLEFIGGQLYVDDVSIGFGSFLSTVDLSTGVETFIGENTASYIDDLAWDGHTLWAVATDVATGAGQLLVIDRSNAAATLVGATGTVVNGLTTTGKL